MQRDIFSPGNLVTKLRSRDDVEVAVVVKINGAGGSRTVKIRCHDSGGPHVEVSFNPYDLIIRPRRRHDIEITVNVKVDDLKFICAPDSGSNRYFLPWESIVLPVLEPHHFPIGE